MNIKLREMPVFELQLTDEEDKTGLEFVSIVDNPAIDRNFLAFDSKKELFQVKDKERRIISGFAMVADLPIYRRDEHYGEHFVVFTKDTIEKVVMRFFKNAKKGTVNGMHTVGLDGVFIFESFILDKERGTTTPKGFDEAPEGSWFISMKVESDQIWEGFIKTGKFKGFSIEGMFDPVHIGNEEEKDIKKAIDAIQGFINVKKG